MFNNKNANRILTAFLAASVLTSFTAALLPSGAITSYAAQESANPVDPGIKGLEYELKFLLDAEKVLDQDHALADGYQGLFGITDEPHQLDVLYLETLERDFNQEGWI